MIDPTMLPVHITILAGIGYIIAALRRSGIHVDFHIWTNGKEKKKPDSEAQ